MKELFTTVLFIALYLHVTAQQPGTLDLSFGDEGKLIDTAKLINVSLKSPMVVQKDGKIVLGASSRYMGSITHRITRLLHDGSLDVGFGDKGNAYAVFHQLHLPAYNLQLMTMALQPDGKIVSAGWGSSGICLARFTEQGTPDSSFGVNGTTVLPTAPSYSYDLTSMAVQPDGKMLFAGSEEVTGRNGNFTYAAVLFRCLNNGMPDESFGKGGKVTSAEGIGINALALQPDGKILAGGYNGLGPDYDNVFYTERYLPDGTLDKSFGKNGGVATFFEDEYCTLKSLALQTDGRIVVTGTYNYKDAVLLLARYDENGNLDKSFNDSGKVITKLPTAGTTTSVGVLVQQSGKIIVAGTNYNLSQSNSADFVVISYNQDGTPDKTFGEGGFTITDITGIYDIVKTAALQPDGKIVVAGYTKNISENILVRVLARYNGYDSNEQPLIVRIKRWLQHRGISWQSSDDNRVRYYAVQRSQDGITYKEIAKVNNSAGANTYEDIAALNTDSYYRILAVGKDGSRTYSNTVLINDAAQQARVFPNPVRDNLQVQGLPQSGKTNVSIVDWNGNVRNTATATGTNYSVNTANLTAGTYLLKIQHGGTVTTQPFVKE